MCLHPPQDLISLLTNNNSDHKLYHNMAGRINTEILLLSSFVVVMEEVLSLSLRDIDSL